MFLSPHLYTKPHRLTACKSSYPQSQPHLCEPTAPSRQVLLHLQLEGAAARLEALHNMQWSPHALSRRLHLTAVLDHARRYRHVHGRSRCGLDLPHDVHALDDLPEHHVPPVQPVRRDGAQEEL